MTFYAIFPVQIICNMYFFSTHLLHMTFSHLTPQHNEIVYEDCKNNQASYRTSYRKRNTIHNSFHKSMQKHKQNYCIYTPCDGTFQTENSFVIKWFFMIVPPDFSKQTIHQKSSNIFDCCCKNGSEKKQKNLIVTVWSKQKKYCERPHSINWADRPSRKSSIGQSSVAYGHINRFYEPAKYTVS